MAGSKAKSTSSQKKTKRKPGSAPIQTKAKPKNQPGPKGGSKQRGNKLNNAAASQDAVGNQASSRTGKNDESKKKKPESQLVKDLKAIMRDVARWVGLGDLLSAFAANTAAPAAARSWKMKVCLRPPTFDWPQS